jgi:hypothetical protein
VADLRVVVEAHRNGRPTQRIYLDGHEMSGVRQVRVCSEGGDRIASLDLNLDEVSIDPRTVSGLRAVCGEDKVDITIEADNVNGPVTPDAMPRWTRGPVRAYRRPDVFDRARDCYSRLAHVDWLTVIGVTYLVITVLGVVMEHAVLDYANGLRRPADDE